MKRLALFIMLIATLATARAQDFEVDGIYYNVIDLSQLTAQVTASPNKSYLGDLIVPRHVSYNGRTLTVERVEFKAFDGCSNLTSLYVEDSVMMNVLPTNCSNLTSLRLPSTITSLSGECNCYQLKSFEIPENVETIAANTFRKAYGLKSIHLPASVKMVGGMLGSIYAETITIADDNPYLMARDGWIFNKAGDTLLSCLTSNVSSGDVVLPDDAQYVADEIFTDLLLKSLHLPSNLKVMSKMFNALSLRKTMTELPIYFDLTLPEKVETIKTASLQDLPIENLVIPRNVKVIENQPFGTGYPYNHTEESWSLGDYYYPLRSIVFEDGQEPLNVESILWFEGMGDSFFQQTTMHLGRPMVIASGDSFTGQVFSSPRLKSLTTGQYCDDFTLSLVLHGNAPAKLDTIILRRNTPPVVDVTFSNAQYLNLQLSVPRQAMEKYQQAKPWKNFWNIIPLDNVGPVTGDLTGDSNVDVSDVNIIIDMVLGKAETTPAADLNGDGQVDVSDVNAIIDIVLGKVPSGDDEPVTHTYTVNGVSFDMVSVRGGTFSMGGTAEQQWVNDNEKPVHQVTVSDFSIGQTEVTQELWKAVMGYNSSKFSSRGGYDDDFQRPVEMVTRVEALEFISRLNQLTGQTFRLPTEAEWEFAARGGTKSKGTMYAGSDDPDHVAWCAINSEKITHAVGTKAPNELGLYDMSGNVYEWCSDYFCDYSSAAQTNPTGPATGDKVAVRGASWYHAIRDCRVSARLAIDPARAYDSIGLRLAK